MVSWSIRTIFVLVKYTSLLSRPKLTSLPEGEASGMVVRTVHPAEKERNNFVLRAPQFESAVN